jgi:ribosomal protein S18 acetylase RimI-like enzyme
MAEHDKAVRRVPGDVRKEVKAEVRVIRLPIERLGEAADLFARSFHTKPNFMDPGVGVWLPPRAGTRLAARQLRALPGMAGVMATAPLSTRRLLRYTTGIARLHSAQPYWYLELVGVDPTVRGLGIGTRLLERVLADEAGLTCYLETMTERNVGWYRSLGFAVREAGVRFVRGGPPNWTMIRGGRTLPGTRHG